jgi:phosphatidylinositol alpha-1,6-mannosyltransferase
VAQWRPDEIHFGQLVVGGLCGVIVKKLFGVPFVVYCHGADMLEFIRHRPGRIVVRTIFSRCSSIITCSSFTARQAWRFMENRPLKIAVLNPCVEARFFGRDSLAEQRLEETYGCQGKKIVLSVGRLVQRKGHDTIIRACAILKDRIPALRYMIVGDGPYRGALEEVARDSGMHERVLFCGVALQAELPSYYRLASVFVMVPRYLEEKGDVEGFGIVFLEANAAGLPVVGGRSGGVEDAVRHGVTGLLVDNPSDPSAIARAIERIVTDETLHSRLSENALKWAQEHSCERMRKKGIPEPVLEEACN